MKLNLKSFKISILLGMIICFFLPFAAVSCENREITKVNGFQFVTGSRVSVFGESAEIPIVPLMVISFIIILALGIYIFMIKETNNVFMALMNILLGGMILLFKSELTKRANEEGFTVSYKIGFWLIMIFTIANSILYIYLQYNENRLKVKASSDLNLTDET